MYEKKDVSNSLPNPYYKELKFFLKANGYAVGVYKIIKSSAFILMKLPIRLL